MIPIPAAALPVTSLDSLFNGPATVVSSVQVLINGTVLSNGAIQRLAMCPAGGTVTVTTVPDGIVLCSEHPTLIINRHMKNFVRIEHDAQGYYLYADYIWFAASAPIGPAPKGLGAVALLLMAHAGHALQLERIELLAAGGTGAKGSKWNEKFWGFEVWPRMGFDTELQPAILNLIQHVPLLAGCTHVSEIIEKDLPWWQANGDGWDMSFDLTPGSDSWDTLYHFCLDRGLLQ